jgi:predicted RecB family nuclease
MLNSFQPEHIGLFKEEWRTTGDHVHWIEDRTRWCKRAPRCPMLTKMARSLSFPVIEDGGWCSRSTSPSVRRAYPTPARRLHSAIRDQIMIVLQNQRLLRDTRTAPVWAARCGCCNDQPACQHSLRHAG